MGYARTGNPTWTALEDVLGTLEGGQALAFASGMAAVAAVFDLLPQGAVLVAPHSPYGGTARLLDLLEADRGVQVRRVDVSDTDETIAAMADAAMLWVESPTNPLLAVADLPRLFEAGRQRRVICCADNTFATPLNQRPLDLGADVVVHSVTKYLAGHSDLVLGAAVTRDQATYQRLLEHRTYRERSRGHWRPGLRCAGSARWICVSSELSAAPQCSPSGWSLTRALSGSDIPAFPTTRVMGGLPR